MAQQIVIHISCDRCAAKGIEAEGMPTPPITIGTKIKPRVVDLCAQCHADVVAPLVELLDQEGRYEESGRRTRRSNGQQSKPEPEPDQDPLACPECNKHLSTPQALGSHRARAHGYRRPKKK